MSTVRYNAIEFQRKLRDAGMNQSLAEIHAGEIQSILNTDIATKQDLTHLENKMVIKLGSLVVGCTFIISIMLGILGYIVKQ